MKKICLSCFHISSCNKLHAKSENKCCEKCGKDEFYFETFFNIFYHEKKYSKKEWYSKTSSFSNFDSTQIKLSDPSFSFSLEQIKHLLLKNIQKYTFLGNILPCILFFIISLISFSLPTFFQSSANFGFTPKSSPLSLYIYFIGSLFLIFSIIFFFLVVIKKQKILLTKFRGNVIYKRLSFNDYNKMLDIIEENIKKNDHKSLIINTNRLIIRPFMKKDLIDYYTFGKNPNVTRYLMWENFKNIDEAKIKLHNILHGYKMEQYFTLAIEEKETKTVIGYIGLSQYDYSLYTCQIVYAIGEAYWHKGYMQEALKSYVSYLFSIGKKVIYAGHVDENKASGHVLIKCGFVRDEKRDSELIIHGEKKKIIRYVLTNDK